MSFNKKKYETQLDLYIKKINENNQAQSELEERETRKKYYNGYDYEKIIKMSEEEFYEYISKLWTMIIWGIKNDFLFIDYLFWDNLKLYKSSIKKSSDSIIAVTTIENKKSLHTELKEKLEILVFSWDLMLLMK